MIITRILQIIRRLHRPEAMGQLGGVRGESSGLEEFGGSLQMLNLVVFLFKVLPN